MRRLLSILLISSLGWGCNNAGTSGGKEADSTSSAIDSALGHDSPNSGSALTPDPEAEKRRQVTQALLSSKNEINELASELSDSLTRSGLSHEKQVFYRSAMLQLNVSSDILNRQLEQILVSDLETSRDKLGGIVKKMKGSEKDLQGMIARLDRVTGFLETAASLIQSLTPLKPAPPKPASQSK